ncbi:MAG: hypothetical protein J2P41_10785 [Blastocatellia bacterium]|nr:hypothetical protein [Blastocatellia bacterium]
MDRLHTRLLREMTIEESVRDYLMLCHSFAPFIIQSRDFFLPDRIAYLTELQERLRRFAEWKKREYGSSTESI